MLYTNFRWASIAWIAPLFLLAPLGCGSTDDPAEGQTAESNPEAESRTTVRVEGEDGEVHSTDELSSRKQGLYGDLDDQVRILMRLHGVEKPETLGPYDSDVIKLGRKLFFDKALSGRKDVACATCHHTDKGAETGDGLSLGVGVGGVGSVPNRRTGSGLENEPRHSIELFNRGLKGWETQFWDGRVQRGPNGELVTPPGEKMQIGLKGVVEAQAMLPVTSRIEMRGFPGDSNRIAQVPDGEVGKIWSRLMKRLLSYPGYRKLFKKAYPNKKLSELKFRDAANAIGRFERKEFTYLDAPFDKYLQGDDDALTKKQKKGARIFYGKGDCASCHSGTLTTDQEFHNIAAPQIGPGKGSTKPLDPGRFIVTGQRTDKFEFRTPPLRNVELTPPYMHSGAYKSLEKAIEHHLEPAEALRNYDASQLRKSFREQLHNSKSVRKKLLGSLDWRLKLRAIVQDMESHPLKLTDKDVDYLVAFLRSMTSPKADKGLDMQIPSSVPSGLLADGE